MPRGVVDISLVGDKELLKKFARLEGTEGRKLVVKAMRNSAKRMKPIIAAATPVKTGKLKAGMAKAKVRSAGSRSLIRLGLVMPTREELDIPADAKGYYPFALEYGTEDGRMAPRRFIRGTVDAHADAELAAIGRELGAAIEAEARK